MNIKKFLAVFLSVFIIFSSLFVGVNAADGKKNAVPAFIETFDEMTGKIVNWFVVYWNKLTNKTEPSLPEAQVEPSSWIAYDGEEIKNPDILLEAESWLMNEITLVSDKVYSDPFNEADVELLLWGNGRLYKIPAFWDGGNIWRVRFACPTEGIWYFETVCTDSENLSLHKVTGKVNCREYSGELDIYKHGFVTTRAGEKYLTYDDGTPFFYLGDTHWSLGSEGTQMVEIVCEKRVSQQFTVFQSEPIGASFDFTNGITEDDIYGLRLYDEKFEVIAKYGLVHANAQFFFTYFIEPLVLNFGGFKKDGSLSDGAKLYLEKISRYWVARYGAFPVIWTLGQEADNDFYADSSYWNYKNNPYKLVAEYLGKYDAYDHPLTAHQENAGSTVAYGNGEGATDKCKVYKDKAMASVFRDVKEHNLYAAQWTPSKTKQTDFEIEKDYWYNSQGKPVINYEGQYCYLWTKNYGARMQGYLAYLNGMYGYGWGAQDTWCYLSDYDEANDSSDGVDTITSEEKTAATWEDALEFESSYQMGYMREFLENTQWYKLIPRFDNKEYFVPASDVYYVYAGNEDNTEIVIYFYSFSDKSVAQKPNASNYAGYKTGTVGSLEKGGRYTCQWFNPVTGEYYDAEYFTATGIGTFYIGEKPCNSDMVLLIKKA